MKRDRRRAVTTLSLLALSPVSWLVRAVGAAQSQGPAPRPLRIVARKYRFEPARIEVNQDDLVMVEVVTADIAHSFTIDAYRIAKRVSPGQPVTFEFRADTPGTFPYYCNLQIDEGCKQMRGELVVKPRK
jgi:cytochrome c oxidase subunit 2